MTQIEQIKQLLDQIHTINNYKIGIGVTTYNRPEMFKKCIESINEFMPKNSCLVIVDDASTIPVGNSTFRFDKNSGIANSKNKCLELLYKQNCDYYFLFDDDCWPISADWHIPYIESCENHLMYIFENFKTNKTLSDCKAVYRDNKKIAYSHPRGCMLFFSKKCLDEVGGMYADFGKWGFEHVDLSNRIFNAGLTSFRYMDVIGSDNLFYSDDYENNNKNSTVDNKIRSESILLNQPIYEARANLKTFEPFYEKENLFLSSYFSNVIDPQRGSTFVKDMNQLNPLIASCKNDKIVILTDCFATNDIFHKVETFINPYFQRWISYYEYLTANKHLYKNVFCVDATDVEILKSPNWNELGNFIYTGDEPSQLDNPWLRSNHKSSLLQDFINSNGKKYQLLNAGVLGGSTENVIDFCRSMIDYYSQFGLEDQTDMGGFNYVARARFGDRLIYGREITTEFKKNEKTNYSWIRHK